MGNKGLSKFDGCGSLNMTLFPSFYGCNIKKRPKKAAMQKIGFSLIILRERNVGNFHN